MREFLYIDNRTRAPIKVFAKKRPSIKSMPRSGTWVVNEWNPHCCGGKWQIPCFPEILWERLNSMIFVGEIKERG
jgi:hypothetical protein